MSHAAPASLPEIDHAADVLARGELAAFPTETVYGLGADAENPEAIARIYAAKGRPSNHPVIVHVAPEADLSYWAGDIPPLARALIDAFWPGPLTLILPRAAHIPDTVSGGQDSVGLRCPSHPVAQQLLRAFARRRGGHGGVAAPSANKFGQVSPTHAAHVRSEFPELVAAGMPVLEGGASEVGIESTILDLSRLDSVGPVLLRPGHVTAARIAEITGSLPALPDAAAPRVSGSLKAHYAPRTPLRLASAATLAALATGQGLPATGRYVLVSHTRAQAPADLSPRVDWHAAPAAADAYAAGLYAMLRSLDLQGYAGIVLEAPPEAANWLAVRDRVGRAAAAFDADDGAAA